MGTMFPEDYGSAKRETASLFKPHIGLVVSLERSGSTRRDKHAKRKGTGTVLEVRVSTVGTNRLFWKMAWAPPPVPALRD